MNHFIQTSSQAKALDTQGFKLCKNWHEQSLVEKTVISHMPNLLQQMWALDPVWSAIRPTRIPCQVGNLTSSESDERHWFTWKKR